MVEVEQLLVGGGEEPAAGARRHVVGGARGRQGQGAEVLGRAGPARRAQDAQESLFPAAGGGAGGRTGGRYGERGAGQAVGVVK